MKSTTVTPTWSLVYSMNNIANIYCRMQKYSQAKSLLEQALQKLNEEESPHKGAVGLTYDSLGKLSLSQEKYREASDLFQKAVEIRKNISANGLTHVESMMHLVKAEQKIGNPVYATKLAKKVISLSEATNRIIPTNTYVSETLEVLADIYRSMGGNVRVKSTVELLQSELMRQELVYMGSCDTKRVNEIATKLSDIRKSLQHL